MLSELYIRLLRCYIFSCGTTTAIGLSGDRTLCLVQDRSQKFCSGGSPFSFLLFYSLFLFLFYACLSSVSVSKPSLSGVCNSVSNSANENRNNKLNLAVRATSAVFSGILDHESLMATAEVWVDGQTKSIIIFQSHTHTLAEMH